MLARSRIYLALLVLWPVCTAAAAGEAASSAAGVTATASSTSSERADKRYEEMLSRMQAAVEEIAQLYGSPLFLQVFTNDEERAAALKQRLRSAGSADAIRKELADLQKKRENLLNDIALKEREVAKLSERLARQRMALDALAGALEQARTAVEDTTK
jgi:chromosome segregation ATPase